MSRLFETIRVEDGVVQHPEWHEQRMNRARRELWQGSGPVILNTVLRIPPEFSAGLVRCNIFYGPEIGEITFRPYIKKMILSLRLVICDSIDYHLKFSDRLLLDSLLALRGECDEIIIVRNGLLTDTSMSNIIFLDGNRWVTPAKPLLNGTCRQRLIAEGRIAERDIRPGDIATFVGCKIINALRSPDEEMIIPVSQIIQDRY